MRESTPDAAPMPAPLRNGHGAAPSPDSSAEAALRRARDHLLSLQWPDGHWCGELEADSVVESEYILLLHFLGRTGEARVRKAAEHIRRLALPEGGWAIYDGGPPEVSASVKAYFVLKLLGDHPAAPHMAAARRRILELGGIEAVNTYTKIYLALFGQYPWDRCPAIPPEMMLLPDWFFVSVNDMSSWSRGIFVPLSIVWAHRPRRPVPAAAAIPELRVPGAPGGGETHSLADRGWAYVFLGVDRGLKVLERARLTPLRRRALRVAERWILERLADSDGLGAIFPAIVNTVLAFRCLGYADDHPAVAGQLAALEKLEVEEGSTLRIQPTLSPVWDTAQAMNALAVAGVEPDDPAMVRGARWLVEREVRRPGDWRHRNPGAGPGGWYFEYANEFYPDCDDTAKVLTALSRVSVRDPDLRARIDGARARGLEWLLSMQNPDGGWGAFDRGCDRELLTRVPFADHNAMIDPSWEDITGRTLETLRLEGRGSDDPAVRRAVRFLEERQCEDGTWYGRWGCNYIYGTWLALQGLRCAGEDLGRPRYRRAARWLRERQNEDGGWGETLGSYDDPSLKGVGPSTAAQTAWALLGLMAAGERDSAAVRRGIGHLVRTQRGDGSWVDGPWTGTGFPRVFYLRYHLYDDYFPLLALATFARADGHAARPLELRGSLTVESGGAGSAPGRGGAPRTRRER